eukprot:1886325-Rhodomonas_salina.1
MGGGTHAQSRRQSVVLETVSMSTSETRGHGAGGALAGRKSTRSVDSGRSCYQRASQSLDDGLNEDDDDDDDEGGGGGGGDDNGDGDGGDDQMNKKRGDGGWKKQPASTSPMRSRPRTARAQHEKTTNSDSDSEARCGLSLVGPDGRSRDLQTDLGCPEHRSTHLR